MPRRAYDIPTTNNELATATGLERTTVSKILNGRIRCSERVACQIHRLTNGAWPWWYAFPEIGELENKPKPPFNDTKHSACPPTKKAATSTT